MSKTSPPAQTNISLWAWTLLAVLALIWGGSFLSNRAALTELGFLTTVAFRVGGAAMVLWAYVLWRGLPVPAGGPWLLTCVVLGILNNVVPFCLIVWGQTHIASGLAGILNATTAIFSVLLAALVYPDERLTLRKSVGVALGLAGVALTIGPQALAHLDFTSLGQLAILGAALSYSVSGIYGRTALRGIRPEVAAAGMLTVSSAILIPAALYFEGTPTFHYLAQTWAALGYLALLASAFAYILVFRVLQIVGAGNLGLVTLLIAPVAVILGALVYGEALPPAAYLGLLLLATGMLVLDGRLFTIFRVKTA